MTCRHCGREIRHCGREIETAGEMQIWLSIEIGHFYFCERANSDGSFAFHQPLIESVEEMLDALRSIESDLR